MIRPTGRLNVRSMEPEAIHVLSNNADARYMLKVASDRQLAHYRELYGDDIVDRCLRGGKTLKQCQRDGHTVSAWNETADDGTIRHYFQHGTNPRNRLVLNPSDNKWPWADGPVGEWVERVHNLTAWIPMEV